MQYAGIGKFDSAIDELLYDMASQGWANESTGNVEAPTGYFHRIEVHEGELAEISDAFDVRITELSQYDDFELSELVGHWLCTDTEQGLWLVEQFDSHLALQQAYDALATQFEAWDNDEAEEV